MAANDDAYTTFLDMAFKKVWNYCTSLFASDDGQAAVYRGSGTLVRWGAKRCLLTAAHVWESLADFQSVGLSIDDGRPALTIRRSCLLPLHSSSRVEDVWGPDLALIQVADADAGTLEARGKSFYDLTRRQPEALASTPSTSGIWALVGAPGEFVEAVARRPQIGLTQFDVGVCILASVQPRMQVRNGFDYAELQLQPKTTGGFPERYNGYSGSGLWRLGEADDTQGTVTWNDKASLEGVAFCQVPARDPQFIRCHGRYSIFRNLLGAV